MRLTAAVLAWAVSMAALAENTIQVMVVGSYHMGNPGQDVHNIEAADVTTPDRQAELAAVARALAEFKPTVIAVERVTEPPEYHDPGYESFSEAVLTEQPNERVQLGYRIAHKLGLDTVHGIDEQPSEGEPDYFPFGKFQQQVAQTGQAETMQRMQQEIGARLGEFEKEQGSRSIAELLVTANQLLSDASFYYEMLKLDQGEAQAASELIAYYFMRNAKIFAKLIDVTTPGDRVLVIYGAGHKHWLDHLVSNTPGFQSVDPLPYLETALGER